MLNINFDPETRTHVCQFTGKITSAACPPLAAEIEAKIREIQDGRHNEKVAFDLAGVDFIASAFLRICMLAARQMPPGHFIIVNSQPAVQKIFSIAGLDGLTDTH